MVQAQLVSVAAPDASFQSHPQFKEDTERAVKAAARELSRLLGYSMLSK